MQISRDSDTETWLSKNHSVTRHASLHKGKPPFLAAKAELSMQVLLNKYLKSCEETRYCETSKQQWELCIGAMVATTTIVPDIAVYTRGINKPVYLLEVHSKDGTNGYQQTISKIAINIIDMLRLFSSIVESEQRFI